MTSRFILIRQMAPLYARLCHTRDSRLSGFRLKCLLHRHVRCALVLVLTRRRRACCTSFAPSQEQFLQRRVDYFRFLSAASNTSIYVRKPLVSTFCCFFSAALLRSFPIGFIVSSSASSVEDNKTTGHGWTLTQNHVNYHTRLYFFT